MSMTVENLVEVIADLPKVDQEQLMAALSGDCHYGTRNAYLLPDLIPGCDGECDHASDEFKRAEAAEDRVMDLECERDVMQDERDEARENLAEAEARIDTLRGLVPDSVWAEIRRQKDLLDRAAVNLGMIAA